MQTKHYSNSTTEVAHRSPWWGCYFILRAPCSHICPHDYRYELTRPCAY